MLLLFSKSGYHFYSQFIIFQIVNNLITTYKPKHYNHYQSTLFPLRMLRNCLNFVEGRLGTNSDAALYFKQTYHYYFLLSFLPKTEK